MSSTPLAAYHATTQMRTLTLERWGDRTKSKEVAELGLKPRPSAPKPRIASHDWGTRTGALGHREGPGNSPTSHTWSGDCNNSNHHSARKHKSRAPHLTRDHKTQPLSSPPVPQCHTVTCAVHSHPVSHRPRRCLSCSHGHGTPRPSPQATLRSVPLSSTLPVHSPMPSTPVPLQLRSAHRTPLLTPPALTLWC